jgi:hypothetical protein
MCTQAGLVWGEEFYFDATKVEANASLENRSRPASPSNNTSRISSRKTHKTQTIPCPTRREPRSPKISIRFPPQKIRSSSAPTLPEATGSPKLGAKIGKSRATSTGAKGGPLPQQERSRCLAHEAQGRRPYPPRGYQAHCVVDLKARRVSSWVFWSPPSRSPRTSPCWICSGDPPSGGRVGPDG